MLTPDEQSEMQILKDRTTTKGGEFRKNATEDDLDRLNELVEKAGENMAKPEPEPVDEGPGLPPTPPPAPKPVMQSEPKGKYTETMLHVLGKPVLKRVLRKK